jgi:hypothetical protein
LLEVRHQPAPLKDFGEQVRGLFAGQVNSAELRYRIIAVLKEYFVIQRFGPFQAHGRINANIASDIEVADELVEKEPPERLRRPGVSGKERALHYLGQIDQGEDWEVQVCKIPTKNGLLIGAEFLSDIGGHGGQP